jgi:hypothetical protein
VSSGRSHGFSRLLTAFQACDLSGVSPQAVNDLSHFDDVFDERVMFLLRDQPAPSGLAEVIFKLSR